METKTCGTQEFLQTRSWVTNFDRGNIYFLENVYLSLLIFFSFLSLSLFFKGKRNGSISKNFCKCQYKNEISNQNWFY